MKQGKPTHLMTIEMGALCGMPSTDPDGGRASSDIREVTCDACLVANVDRIRAAGDTVTDDIMSGERRWVVWDRKIWWRYYREGGFDGYHTLFPPHLRLTCGALAQRVRAGRQETRCQLCHGSGWIPGVAGDGPLDELPCPECRVA